jgi:glycosyltransferase involved in cell wall biosynthesis
VRIAVVANTAWYVVNFRLALMAALRRAGHEVIAITPTGPEVARIAAAGFGHRAFPLSGRGVSPITELGSVFALRRCLKEFGPDVVLTSTPKGNLYSALARMGLHCRQIVNVSGLGTAFIRKTWITPIVQALYRLTFRRMDWVFFENSDDQALFLKSDLVHLDRHEQIPGLGVDLDHFKTVSLPGGRTPDEVVFLVVARVLGDKGIREYAEASAMLRREFPNMRCQLLGSADSDNPSAIPLAELDSWVREGIIEYLGFCDDVRPYLSAATCIVLPSYREGMPRSLLEGAAMGRPLITTDVPGCRETVVQGHNGFLCKVRDADDLAGAMRRILESSLEEREVLGANSRRLVEENYSEDIVISRYLRVITMIG